MNSKQWATRIIDDRSKNILGWKIKNFSSCGSMWIWSAGKILGSIICNIWCTYLDMCMRMLLGWHERERAYALSSPMSSWDQRGGEPRLSPLPSSDGMERSQALTSVLSMVWPQADLDRAEPLPHRSHDVIILSVMSLETSSINSWVISSLQHHHLQPIGLKIRYCSMMMHGLTS